jgi:uncharacterized protein (DUF58 family)
LPLDRWLPIFIVSIYLGLILESPLLMALPISLMILLSIAAWWRRHALDHLIYRRRFQYTRAFPGESFPVKIEIENRKLLPLTWLRTVDPWPKAVGPEGEDILAPSFSPELGFLTHVFSLRWYERSRRTYNLVFRKRGIYPLGPCKLTSGDLFGIYDKALEVAEIDRLTVFPAMLPLEELHLAPEYPIGDERSRRRISEDPNQVMGVRDYQPEDNFRKIHWPATARTGQLQVKVYQPTSAQVLVVCLNVSTSQRYWEGFYPDLLEYMLSLAASLVDRGIQDGYRVGIISNGCLTNSDQPFHTQPGRSPQQLATLLSALAGITPVVVARFERLLLREIPRAPFGATLLILTAVINPELIETIIRLKKHERRITLLSVAEEAPPNLPGIQSLHLPFRYKGD